MKAEQAGRQVKAVFTTREIEVATYDIDFAGVVSNTVYVKWMEDMRLAMTRAPHYLPLVSLMNDEVGIAPAITHTDIHYRRPIRLGDQVVASVWMSQLTSRKIYGQFEFHVNGKLAAYGSQTGCFINIATKKFASTPQSWLDIFEQTIQT